MKSVFIKVISFFYFLTISFPVFSQGISSDTDERMDWWRKAKFGMFIHWGVYSVFENMYDGVNVRGEQIHYDMRDSAMPSEWIMFRALIPRNVYREAAKQFDAKDYDPKLWVQIAKEAGMKYIVITTKHHDGFCLFDTQYTDWNAVDASSAGRDLLKDLVDEAKAAGLKIGFYYSQNLDWMYEGGMGEIPELNMGHYSIQQVHDYVNNLVIPHIQELTSKYDFDMLWFDGQYVTVDTKLNNTILKALKESPVGHKVIINDRLCLDCEKDFITPETDTPDIPYNGFSENQDWEACASLNSSWGYEGDSESYYWKSPLFTISRVLEIASKGGNFLLNVGPDKHGVIPQPAVNTLKEVGKWMETNREAVYGTEKNQLLNPFEYGYVTQKSTPDGRFHWYLHVSSSYWNEGKIYLYGIKEQPVSATYLADNTKADIKWEDNILTVNLPETSGETYYTTIDLCFNHLPEQVPLSQMRNNQIRLTPYQAVTSNGIRKDFQPYALKEWFLKNCEVRYNIHLERGIYTVRAEYAACETGELYININNSVYTAHYSKTENYKVGNADMDNYITDSFPDIKIFIPKSGIYQLTITRNAEIPNHFNIINVRSFTLNHFDTDTLIPGITDKVLFYPNPVKNGYFYCTAVPGQNIRIYDATGLLIKSCVLEENQIIDVSDLRSGVYFVTGKDFSQKIIVVY